MADKPQHMPWAPAEAEIADVAALKAMARGEASDEQQKRALKWIVETAAETYGMGWHPDSEQAASFAAGKRHVGRQIVGYVNIPMEEFKRAVAQQQRKKTPNGGNQRSDRSRRKRSG